MSYHNRIEDPKLANLFTTRTKNAELWFVNNHRLKEPIPWRMALRPSSTPAPTMMRAPSALEGLSDSPRNTTPIVAAKRTSESEYGATSEAGAS